MSWRSKRTKSDYEFFHVIGDRRRLAAINRTRLVLCFSRRHLEAYPLQELDVRVAPLVLSCARQPDFERKLRKLRMDHAILYELRREIAQRELQRRGDDACVEMLGRFHPPQVWS